MVVLLDRLRISRLSMQNRVMPIILGFEEDLDILCNLHGCCRYISLEDLEFIKLKIDKSIKFAQKNDIDKLNEEFVERVMMRDLGEYPKRKSEPLTNIYIMLDKRTGFYKIGKSDSPTKRERTLQSDNPLIELVAHYRASYKQEQVLHNTYSEKRVRGEWFRLDENDLENIKSYLENAV